MASINEVKIVELLRFNDPRGNVLASDVYRKEDYIHEYDEFLKYKSDNIF